jgi:phosphoglycolate phosphatase-like HAD superfamily hydrolase
MTSASESIVSGQPRTSGTVVLLDWNGTVVLDKNRARASLNQVLRDRELPVLTLAGFEHEFHLPMRDMFNRLGVPDAADAEDEWNRAMTTARAAGREGLESLRTLARQGTRLGVVSAASAESVQFDMDALGLAGIWDSIDAPAPDKIATLTARRGTEDRAYYLGDTPYDMTCALRTGYIPVAVHHGYARADALQAAGAQLMIENFTELEALVAEGAPRS